MPEQNIEETGTDPQSRPRSALNTAAGLLAIAILIATAFVGWQWKHQRDNDIAAREGLSAAQRFVGVLTNIDGGKLDENFTSAADGSTGEFKDQYAQSSAQLRRLLAENKAAAHGMVVESAVKSASPDTVEVLLFVDQSVSNATNPQPRLDRSRIRMTMKKIDGRWLASKVELP
ncbi:hypothetical protein AB0876_00540 [Mycobacterium sp. NPDC049093]